MKRYARRPPGVQAAIDAAVESHEALTLKRQSVEKQVRLQVQKELEAARKLRDARVLEALKLGSKKSWLIQDMGCNTNLIYDIARENESIIQDGVRIATAAVQGSFSLKLHPSGWGLVTEIDDYSYELNGTRGTTPIRGMFVIYKSGRIEALPGFFPEQKDSVPLLNKLIDAGPLYEYLRHKAEELIKNEES